MSSKLNSRSEHGACKSRQNVHSDPTLNFRFAQQKQFLSKEGELFHGLFEDFFNLYTVNLKIRSVIVLLMNDEKFDSGFTNKMHLYLRNGEQQRWLIIHLLEGHIPRVAGLSSEETKYVTDNIEPAIWFKVMVLESISIDCLKRVVYWTNGIKGPDGIPITYSMYDGDRSCYDFDDDIDELFNLAYVLIETNPLAIANEAMRNEKIVEYEQNLFRMLHCYILSKITLQPHDIDCVYNALQSQNKSITQLDDLSLMHSRLKEHYLSQMRNLREIEILPLVEQLVEENRIDKAVLQVLYYDLNKGEPLIRKEIDKAQKQVDHLKEMMAIGASSNKLSRDLADARKNRDTCHKNLVTYIVGKELTRQALEVADRDKAKKVELNEACQQYMKLHKRVEEERSISLKAMEKKVKAASVRECIQAVIRDLVKGKETSGDDMTVHGQRPTDVMDGENPHPEWQTLSQRLSVIVNNRDNPVGLEFSKFCQTLHLNYRKKLCSVENITCGSSRFMTSFDDFYVISEVDMGLNKAYLEDQKHLILNHLSLMTDLLTESFQNRNVMFIRKLRLCYEKCFFNRIGRDLLLIYRVIHGKSMQTIEQRVTSLESLPLCKLGLQMRNEWWLQLFEAEDNVDQNDCDSIESLDDSDADELLSDTGLEYGDNEHSDCDSEDYCTDTEGGDNYLHKFPPRYNDRDVRKMKTGLKTSADKVLSRSLGNSLSDINLTSSELIMQNSRLLEKEIADRVEHSRPRFSSESMSKFLKDDDHKTGSHSQLRKYNSMSSLSVERSSPQTGIAAGKDETKVSYYAEDDSFNVHFGEALNTIRGIFTNSSPLKKMQCLSSALRLVTMKVEELRMRVFDSDNVDRSKVSISADDLLPLVVLVLLKMSPHDVAKLYVELLFVADLMADFLSSGCHSYALCHFQIAFRVLDQTCEELSL